jgi:serine/threonine protein phosphatase 1
LFLSGTAVSPARYPGLEGAQRLYVIGDIHGRADLLARTHALIDRDRAASSGRDGATEIYLGDYVDRGPNSREVLDALIRRASACDVRPLRGNHEDVFLNVLGGRETFERWKQVGGLETLVSYGVEVGRYLRRRSLDEQGLLAALRERVPATHVRLLQAMAVSLAVGPYFFAHAGIRPGRPLSAQSSRDLLWIRSEFLASQADFGAIVVHGHTPTREVEYRPNRINIDTGAYLSNRLTCLRIDRDGVHEMREA